jgi:DNA invertase Pin-like site-specific DNA recombinase
MAWSVDRLGRSLQDLVNFLMELRGSGVDLFLHKQGLDTGTSSGRAMFGMLSVFADFERDIITERINAGIARAKAEGKQFGRPRVPANIEKRIRASLKAGTGIHKTAKTIGVGTATVQRIKSEMTA